MGRHELRAGRHARDDDERDEQTCPHCHGHGRTVDPIQGQRPGVPCRACGETGAR